MAAEKHAVLSASSAHRWLNCPPSVRLSEGYKDKGSDYAAEGTDAHSLCEYKLRTALGMVASNPTEHLTWYSEEMADCADGYAAYVLEQVEASRRACPDPLVLIEQRVDFSRWVRDGFGTADAVIIADGVLKVIDYKHGRGVEVSAEKNPQMMCYALGALELFDALYDIESVSMTIYQPRLGNISSWEIAKKELYRWAERELKPAAELAYAGEGEFRSGDWCIFCKARFECRARADANLELTRHDFQLPPLLEDDEIADLLPVLDRMVSWANDIKDYALRQAVSGKKWNGWKLVEGRSNRRYTDEDAVAAVVSEAGYDPYERKVLGITAMTKLLGRTRFNALLADYIAKPRGKPALVPVSDRRPEMNTAMDDFKEEN